MTSEPTFTDLTKLARRTGVPKRELDRIVHRLVEAYDPIRVCLFGSFSWGQPHWNSDLDFCIIVKTDEEAKHREKAHKVFSHFVRKNVDFYLCSKRQFEKMISNPATMEHKIHHEADVLYSQPEIVFDENQPLHREEHDLLKEAESDLIASRRLLIDPPLFKKSLFHVQQCIEFSLRAFRTFHLQPIIKSHQLNYLRKLCGVIEPAIKNIEGFSRKKDAERLADYYWLRYHNKDVEIPSDTAGVEAEIAVAERVYEFVKHYIETTEPPTEPTEVPETKKEREA